MCIFPLLRNWAGLSSGLIIVRRKQWVHAGLAHWCYNWISTILIAGITPFGDLSELDFESINLLTDFGAGSAPTFSIVGIRTYIKEISKNSSTAIRTSILPPNFLLSLSYRPHDNTVLRLLSTRKTSTLIKPKTTKPTLISNNENASDHQGNSQDWEDATSLPNATSSQQEEPEEVFASLMMGLGVLYLQPSNSKYYTFWSGVTSNRSHTLVFVVSNGSISSCLDGDFIEDNPKLTLWDPETDVDQQPVNISFSKHLHSVQQLVSSLSIWLLLLLLLLLVLWVIGSGYGVALEDLFCVSLGYSLWSYSSASPSSSATLQISLLNGVPFLWCESILLLLLLLIFVFFLSSCQPRVSVGASVSPFFPSANWAR